MISKREDRAQKQWEAEILLKPIDFSDDEFESLLAAARLRVSVQPKLECPSEADTEADR
jgi:hypothetical protein